MTIFKFHSNGELEKKSELEKEKEVEEEEEESEEIEETPSFNNSGSQVPQPGASEEEVDFFDDE